MMGLAACTDKKVSNPNPNRPPDTHLFLAIGDSLGVIDSTAMPDTSASMLVLHWYGDDPDGEVIGYEWAWDDTTVDGAWSFTEDVMDTFYVEIDTLVDLFTFYVRAMDSDSAIDPSPSSLTFPIINSAPTVNFPATFINEYASEHSVTLGYHTFTWISSDPDGDESISGYEICLMDSSIQWVHEKDSLESDWLRLDSLTFTHTFEELDSGYYRVFLRCQDIAGAYSDVVYYPETTGVWQVLEPHGEVLYVDDNSYQSILADTMFSAVMNDLGIEFTSLDFTDRPIYYSQDFEHGLRDFDILVYNAGTARNFDRTATGITNFINSGGHVFLNTDYSTSDTIIYPFMPVDSIYDTDVFRPTLFVQPDSLNLMDGYPYELRTTQSISHDFSFAPAKPEGLIGDGIAAIYQIGAANDAGAIGDTMAVRFPYDPDASTQEPARLVFFSFPVFDCNVNDGFRQIFTHILQNEFADE